jgi:hypothetical protein
VSVPAATTLLKRPGAMVDENEVRIAAGLTLVVGAIAFCYAFFDRNYLPLQVVTVFFALEFAARVTLGLRFSPVGQAARLLTFGREPDLVSFGPKRFAWTLGLVMSVSMAIITNSGIRGYLPRTVCLICLALMWLESACGMCLGCQIHRLLVKRGWATSDGHVCAGGVCELH